MIIEKISLKNYRNYEKVELKFNKGINIIIGNNGQGKTNILESLYFLSITKSYRTSDDLILINHNNDFCSIKSKIKFHNIPKNIEINFSKNKKNLLINNNIIKKVSDFIGNVSIVTIFPEDIEIIKGSPIIRRNILNIELSKIDRNYIIKYNEYNKLLKMRNDYLKLLATNSIADYRYLEILTDKLIERALYIYKERKKFIDDINEYVSDIYEDITGIKDLKIIYKNNIDLDKYDNSSIINNLKNKYSKNRIKEISLGMTLYGPHRDDFDVFIDDNNIKFYSSQGQQKLFVISLKLAILKVFNNRIGDMPVLLMDDIFSELDKTRKNKLIEYINDSGQVIITTNDIRDINKKKLCTAKIFEIKNKKIIEKVM